VEKRLRYPYWRIEHELAKNVVRLTRTDVAFRSIEELVASVHEVALALDNMGRSNMALLVDLRQGPMRTDAAFELAMNEQRPRLLAQIPRIAVVVSTPLGAMQLSRHQRQGSLEWATFNEEAPALAHLAPRRPSSP
jgi:hypothetical protein